MNLTAIALEASATTGSSQAASSLVTIGMLVVMFVVLYFFMIRPQKKKQKAEEKMRNDIQVGDEIMTIGGFYGRVISVKEDSLVIESVVDKAKQKIVRTAVQQNLTVHDEKAE